MAGYFALIQTLRFGLGLLTLLWSTPGFAAGPVLDHLFPAAVQVGTTQSISFVGKFDPWPPRVWLDGTGVVVEPTTNNGEFTVIVATNAPVGPMFVRTYNAEGASVPRFLIITAEPQAAEIEPNDDWAAPQVLDCLPTHVNGRLEKNGDVDSFAVKLEAGQTLVAWLESYTLMSPLDPVLRLLDSRGNQVAWNHDDGRSLDPFLAWTAPTPGTYALQAFGFAYPAVSDIRFSGNKRGVYRLHVTTGPYLHHTVPLGVGRNGPTTLQFRGWNLDAETNRDLVFDPKSLEPLSTSVPFQPVGIDHSIELPVGDGLEAKEVEPNSGAGEANRIEIPGAVTGGLNEPGDEDRFSFSAQKGELLLLEIQAATLGFPLDARLKVEDRAGKELVRNDDSAGADPRLEWTAPEDGQYVAAVGNLLQRGGEDQWYRLSICRPKPSLKLTVPESAWTVEPGKTNEIKVTVTRRFGFDAELTVSVKGLPEGVQVEPIVVLEVGSEALLQLVASKEAPPFSGPIRILATECGSGREHEVLMELVSAGENNGVPQGYRRLVREAVATFWLTVVAVPPPEEK